MQKDSRRVVIVGAGPGGLAAAILLARSGVQVTIVEKRSVVGGRTSTMEKDGFKFDVGPTFFLYPQVLREIFAAAGYDLDREVPMTRLDPQYRLVFGAGGELLATPNHQRMEEAIRAISPEDAVRFHHFIKRNRTKLEKFLPFLQSPFESWRDLAKPGMMKLLPLLAPWKSLDQDLQLHFKDDRIRLGFSFQSKYLGMSPFRCPSLFSILSFLEYEHGVFHPTGGCGAVTQAMARIATELGVEIALDEPVETHPRRGGQSSGRQDSAPLPACRRDGCQCRLRRGRPPHVAQPPPPPVDRRTSSQKEVFLLHLHALPRHRGPLRQRFAPHYLPRRKLPGEPPRHRAAARAVGQSILLRPERRRHRRDVSPPRPEHPLRPPSRNP